MRSCRSVRAGRFTGRLHQKRFTHRGRGIASALKLRAIAWAGGQGVRWFYTSSEIGNTPLIAINRRLGYRPGVRRLEVAQDRL